MVTKKKVVKKAVKTVKPDHRLAEKLYELAVGFMMQRGSGAKDASILAQAAKDALFAENIFNWQCNGFPTEAKTWEDVKDRRDEGTALSGFPDGD
jgi:hypothetical protein